MTANELRTMYLNETITGGGQPARQGPAVQTPKFSTIWVSRNAAPAAALHATAENMWRFGIMSSWSSIKKLTVLLQS